MNRDGFARADVDVAFYHDPKAIKLARRLRNPERTMVCLGLYQAVVLASWSEGERVTLEDAAPAWWAEGIDDIAADLAGVGLIDGDGRIPAHAWETWFGPARDARRDRQFEGAIGGLIRSGMSREEAVAEASRRREAQGTLEAPSSPPQVRPNPEHPPVRPAPPTGRAGRGSSSPTPLGRVVAELGADEQVEPDIACAACGDPLSLEAWKPRRTADGRMASVHDRCFAAAQEGAA